MAKKDFSHIPHVFITDGENTAVLDTLDGSLCVINILHHEIHKGNAYTVGALVTDVADDASADTLIIVGTKSLHLVLRASATGSSYAYLYETPTITDNGTAVTIFNKDRTSSLVSTARTFHTPTVGAVGTALNSELFPGGEKNFAVGATGNERDEWILAPGKSYLLRITNKSGAAEDISIAATWYEE